MAIGSPSTPPYLLFVISENKVCEVEEKGERRSPKWRYASQRQSTPDDASRRQSMSFNASQRRSTPVNASQRQSTPVNDGQRRPTTANDGQQ